MSSSASDSSFRRDRENEERERRFEERGESYERGVRRTRDEMEEDLSLRKRRSVYNPPSRST